MLPEQHGASVIDVLDCIVLGAGPAGLATSRALSDRGIDHVVLERDRVGASWQTQRWDSFGLNTPGWCTGFVGDQSHLPAELLAADGTPLRVGDASSAPGL